MSCEQNDIEWFRQQHKALLEARYFFRSDEAVCQAVNKMIEQERRQGKRVPKHLKRSCLNGWVTKDRIIPYEYARLISKLVGLTLARLYPFPLSEDD